MNYLSEAQVLAIFDSWVTGNHDVRAAIMTSSRVNPRARVDRFSDYDIELYVDDIEPYTHDDSWLLDLGTPLVKWPWQPGYSKESWLTRLVIFKEGFRIDFQITEGDLALENYVDGYRVLYDRDGICEKLPSPTYAGHKVRPPTEDEWNKFVHEFWWEATYVAKCLARKELFYAKFMFDSRLRFKFLLKLLEWSLCVDHGWDIEPNKLGRDFRNYLEDDDWEEIASTFANADIGENWIAFNASLDLFRKCANTVAAELGYSYPDTLDREVSAYLAEVQHTAP